MLIGYLIPEFPGQTHNFFWREKEALAECGVEVVIISTRRPPKNLVSPHWAKKAINETLYLFPLKIFESLEIIFFLLLAGPFAWYRCIKLALSADGLSWVKKFRLLLLLPFSAKLLILSHRHRFQHVHVHSCADSANIAMFASQLGKVSYSLTLHNPLSTFGGNQKNKWRNAEFGIVITNKLRDEINRKLAFNLPSRISIAPMGVNTDIFKRCAPYLPFNGKGPLRIFCCARLNHAKGFNYLIEAMCLIREKGIDVELVIAGEDDAGGTKYRKELETLICISGISDHVNLLGAVSEEKVREQLERTHIFVLASIEEPLGVVLMEAMAMNVPVVATNAGGVPELIEDGFDGILVPPSNSAAICEAIVNIAANPHTALILSANGRDKIVRAFNHRISARTISSEISLAMM